MISPHLVHFESLVPDTETHARRGRLWTPHGIVETPVSGIVSELFSSVKEAFENSYKLSSETNPDTIQWTIDVDKAIIALTQEPIEEELRRSIRQCIITEYLHNELGKTDLLEKWAHEGGVK